MAAEIVVEGLRRLEYRGYDSAGIAIAGADGLLLRKRSGKLSRLEDLLKERPAGAASAGIGHTRWATHGGPHDRNAHPHVDCTGKIAVVHNGIIENYERLRDELTRAGHVMASDTDSEVVAHLLEDAYAANHGDLAEAMRSICQVLSGAFTLAALHGDRPETVVGARRVSPLVVGIGDGEVFLASDASAFVDHTRDVLELGEDQVVEITGTRAVITHFDGKPAQGRPYTIDWDAAAIDRGGYATFMEKEIHEQSTAVASCLLGRLTPTGLVDLALNPQTRVALKSADRILILACGTAFHAGLSMRPALEAWTGLPVDVEVASEFRYRGPKLSENTVAIAISQSGETIDTLLAMRHAQHLGATAVAICNTQNASIARAADAALYTHAGPEISVASTKAFVTQVLTGQLLGLAAGQLRGVMSNNDVRAVTSEMRRLPELVDFVIEASGAIGQLPAELTMNDRVLFIGRNAGHAVALEGALKLKELAYIHAEGFAAGELKHGPIALIDSGTPVVVIVPSATKEPNLHGKVISNIQEVRARGGHTLVIAESGDATAATHADVLISYPVTDQRLAAILQVIPLQLLACSIATARGLDVDQPRNLAKSVTVE